MISGTRSQGRPIRRRSDDISDCCSCNLPDVVHLTSNKWTEMISKVTGLNGWVKKKKRRRSYFISLHGPVWLLDKGRMKCLLLLLILIFECSGGLSLAGQPSREWFNRYANISQRLQSQVPKCPVTSHALDTVLSQSLQPAVAENEMDSLLIGFHARLWFDFWAHDPQNA